MTLRVRHFFERKFVQDTLALQVSKIGTTGLSVLSFVLIARLMSESAYGTWGLVQSLYLIAHTLNLTGIGQATSIRLAVAVGAKDEREISSLMAFYMQVLGLWSILCVVGLTILAPPIARLLYGAESEIGVLAAVFSLTVFADGVYALVMIVLQSRRQMRTVGVLQNLNQVVLIVCVVAALLVSPTAAGMVVGHIAYSYLTAGLALLFYWRMRRESEIVFPAFRDIIREARTVSGREYWRFGVANALDKNVALLFTQIPLQLVGVMWGEAAAGYLKLALTALERVGLFTSAIFDNMQAVVPQAVGRGDFAALWRNFLRVVMALSITAVVFFGGLALVLPLVVPWLFGANWIPAIPLLQVLCIYGAVTTVGGVFGPLYRAFDQMRSALLVKVVALVMVLVPGIALVVNSGALGGAWIISAVYVLSVAFTAGFTLPALRRKAEGLM